MPYTASNRRNRSLMTLPRWGQKVLLLAIIPVPLLVHSCATLPLGYSGLYVTRVATSATKPYITCLLSYTFINLLHSITPPVCMYHHPRVSSHQYLYFGLFACTFTPVYKVINTFTLACMYVPSARSGYSILCVPSSACFYMLLPRISHLYSGLYVASPSATPADQPGPRQCPPPS